jgi:hypothetical protein
MHTVLAPSEVGAISCQAGLPGLTRGEHEALAPSEPLKLVKNFRSLGGEERQWTAAQS